MPVPELPEASPPLKSNAGVEDESAERLSTLGQGNLNLLEVLEQTDSRPAVLIALGILTKYSETGNLEEKGDWV